MTREQDQRAADAAPLGDAWKVSELMEVLAFIDRLDPSDVGYIPAGIVRLADYIECFIRKPADCPTVYPAVRQCRNMARAETIVSTMLDRP